MRRGIASVVLTGSLLTAACSGGDTEPVTAPSVSFVAPPAADGTPAENLVLPLTSLLRLSRTDDELINLAAHQLTAQCMAHEGFDYPAYEAPEPHYADVDHPFGPWTEAEIAEGYGEAVGESRPGPIEAFAETLPPGEARAWTSALHGSDPFGGAQPRVVLPDGTEVRSGFAAGYSEGCAFAALDELFGDYRYRTELRRELNDLLNEAAIEAEERSDVVDQALDVWHDCMEDAGVDVAGGGDGPDELQLAFLTEPGVSEEERTVVALDVHCKAEANLHDAYFVARAEAEAAVIEDNLLFVEAWRELVDESLDRAREILSSGG